MVVAMSYIWRNDLSERHALRIALVHLLIATVCLAVEQILLRISDLSIRNWLSHLPGGWIYIFVTVPGMYWVFRLALSQSYRLEREQQQLKQMWQIATEQLPISCWLIDVDGSVVMRFGQNSEPDLLVTATGTGYRQYVEHVCEGRTFAITIIPLENRDSTLPGAAIGLSLDITREKHLEKQLNQSNRDYRMLVEQAADGIFLANADGDYLDVNPRGCAMLGYTRDELRQMNLRDLISNENLAASPLRLDQLSSDSGFLIERELVRKDGRRIRVEINAIRLQDGRMQSIVRDLSERAQAQHRVDFLLQLLANVRESIVATDLEGIITYWGRGAEALYGYTAEEVVGKHINIIAVADKEAEDAAHISSALLQSSWQGEYLQRRKDGTAFWAETFLSVIRDPQGAAVGLVGIDRDITQRKKVEQEREYYLNEVIALYRSSRELQRLYKPEDLAQKIISTLEDILAYRFGAVLLVDATGRLKPFALSDQGYGPNFVVQDKVYVESKGLKLGEGVTGWVARHGISARIDDVRQDSRYVSMRPDIRSELCVPLFLEDQVIGVVNVEDERIGAYSESDQRVLEIVASHIAVAIQQSLLFQQIHAANRRLQDLSRRLVEVQEQERQHLARELHDEIGQSLTGLSLLLETIGGRHHNEGTNSSRFIEAQVLVNRLLVQVRDLSLDLRPTMLDDLGLLPALLWHFERYEKQTGIRVQFRHHGLDVRLDSALETAIYRVTQEALTNVARHAHVQEVFVQAWCGDTEVGLRVEDLGVGFDPEQTLAAAKTGGLSGMRERVELLNGQFTIESAPETGTVIVVELPRCPQDQINQRTSE